MLTRQPMHGRARDGGLRMGGKSYDSNIVLNLRLLNDIILLFRNGARLSDFAWSSKLLARPVLNHVKVPD